MDREERDKIAAIARQVRVDAIRCSTDVGAGHPTSSLSATDLMCVLAMRHLHYDWEHPKLPVNDHLMFSKGHASPLLYALYRAAGVIDEEELLTTYRRYGHRLQGHPTPVLPWIDMATGSLGLGIAASVGIALAGKKLDQLNYRMWVLCGDSEMAEGSVWEALDKAGYYNLDNFTAIVDINRLGQRGPTELEWDLEAYAARVTAFGCIPIVIDGHDLDEIDGAYEKALASDGPTVILARTVKGKGVPEIENKGGWHGTALPKEMADRAIAELGGVTDLTFTTQLPSPGQSHITPNPRAEISLPTYKVGDSVATRRAYGDTLKAMAARPEVVVLDAEVGNSTYSESFLEVAPDRYFEAFISESLMVAAAMGFAARGYVPYASTFGAFFSRAFDFVRMAGISDLPIRLVGSHAGVEIGTDGPSQMALEDLACMRAVIDSVVLYPSDATSAAALVKAMADAPGVAYLRTTRGAYPVLYDENETFAIGKSKIVRQSENDQVTLVGAGVTLHESLAAADMLAERGITARVIDCYSVKPIDVDTLTEAIGATNGRIVVTEDHYPQGGIGEAVQSALSLAGVSFRLSHLAVSGLSCSGTPKELLDGAGISAAHIATAGADLVNS